MLQDSDQCKLQKVNFILTLFRMGLFRAAHGWGERLLLPKICHTYPTMMKLGTLLLYLKKIQKTYKSRDKLLEFCWHQQFFYWKSVNFSLSINTDVDCFWYCILNSCYMALLWLKLKRYMTLEDLFLLDFFLSDRYHDDVMTTLKFYWSNLKILMSGWYQKLTSSCVSFTIYQQCHTGIEGDVTPISLKYQNVHWVKKVHLKKCLDLAEYSFNKSLNSGSAQVQILLAAGVWEIRDDEDLWQWSRLEIRLNVFRWLTIPQKQFIIIFIIIIIIIITLNFHEIQAFCRSTWK